LIFVKLDDDFIDFEIFLFLRPFLARPQEWDKFEKKYFPNILLNFDLLLQFSIQVGDFREIRRENGVSQITKDETVWREWRLVLDASGLLDRSIVQHEHDFQDTSPESFFVEICSANDDLHCSLERLDNDFEDATEIRRAWRIKVPLDAVRVRPESESCSLLNGVPVDCLVPLRDFFVCFSKRSLVV
jgi:hypothetical protein